MPALLDQNDGCALIGTMAAAFSSELRNASRIVREHCDRVLKHGLNLDQATSIADCLLLYLLVRHFHRKRAIEVGTNVGTTAVVIDAAAKLNGGTLTTCDPVDYEAICPESGIRFIKATDEETLAILESEGYEIDFAFFDWQPSRLTVMRLDRVCRPDTIFAVHDYGGDDPKGKLVILALGDYGRIQNGRWFAPGRVTLEDGTDINTCTAFFIPNILF